nr:2796_t:CDS:2 [Entrophospora candida]
MGGIIWTEKDWKGFGQQYDETSLYPSIMQSNVTFPTGKGNKNKKYTHIDLSHAKTLGLQVVLIQDGSPNALVYEKETRILGKIIFGEYINFLFKLKNNGEIVGQIAKRVLNTLWGVLCQRNKFYYNIDISMPELFENPEGEILDNIILVEDCWTLQFSNPRNLFKGEYPQIVAFLLAQGQKIISLHIAPYKDKVKQVHTDGFILEEDPMKPPLIECSEDVSKTLKMLKFEKESECYVKNANQVTWY